jgi:hypothetical protein
MQFSTQGPQTFTTEFANPVVRSDDAVRVSRRPKVRRPTLVGAVVVLACGLVFGVSALPVSANNLAIVKMVPHVAPVQVASVRTFKPTKKAPMISHVVAHTVPRVTPAVHSATRLRSRPILATPTAVSTAHKPVRKTTTTTAVATTVPAAPTTTVLPATPAVQLANLNPSGNIAPSPNFLDSGQCTATAGAWSCDNPCVTSSLTWPAFTNDVGCTNYVLQAINNARSVENLGPMVLPNNWYTLSTAQQLFVVADLERVARGLAPYLGINSALSVTSQQAAQTNADPSIAPGFAMGTDTQGYPGMGGAWASGFSVLTADYMWMYDDGWAGNRAQTTNIVCTSAAAAGCWAHRDQLLGFDPGFNPGVGLGCTTCEVGTGYSLVNGVSSYVDLIELPKSAPPAMIFTWASNVAPYLN